jgi:hypothetical protein
MYFAPIKLTIWLLVPVKKKTFYFIRIILNYFGFNL